MATASSSFCAVRFFSPATRPSQPTYFSQAVRIAPRTFSSSQSLTHTSISSAKSIFAGSPLSFTLTLPSTRGPSRVPITIVAAKGYKMKTHKASAKRFRVTGGGKIVRRKAGKQHLLAKKNTKRKLRLSKMVVVNRSDYDNVIGALPYLKVDRKAK